MFAVIASDCTAQTEPACVEEGGIVVGLYSWSGGIATRLIQGTEGSVTLERISDRIILAKMDVEFDDGSSAFKWPVRFIR